MVRPPGLDRTMETAKAMVLSSGSVAIPAVDAILRTHAHGIVVVRVIVLAENTERSNSARRVQIRVLG